MSGLVLIFGSKRGGSVVRELEASITEQELRRILSTLRRPARLELDGEEVGGAEEANNADDARVRWQWWFDRPALESARFHSEAVRLDRATP